MRQENERLKGIMARIESYDVVVRTHWHLLHTFTSLILAQRSAHYVFLTISLNIPSFAEPRDCGTFRYPVILLTCLTLPDTGLQQWCTGPDGEELQQHVRSVRAY